MLINQLQIINKLLSQVITLPSTISTSSRQELGQMLNDRPSAGSGIMLLKEV
jgi:hypothetical protein